MSDYERIAKAIQYIGENVTEQPSLDELAAHVHLSPFHFQRLFSRWAGTTPKRFLQVLTLELGKQLLKEERRPLLEVADSLGLSSGSRLHDHFVQLEAVTPGEYRSGGRDLVIVHGTHVTPFGTMFVARTPRGVCRAAFVDGGADTELEALRKAWPSAAFKPDAAATAEIAALLSAAPAAAAARPLSLHVAGTNFQIAVWRALLRIPPGAAASYSEIAAAVGSPRAVRAAGTAIGANPVAFWIPCHRVIRQSGGLGGYRWGSARKQAMQVWEQLHRGEHREQS
jgi:AraC family transcriptional regulator of adaptative response/methylated-DNA-[protein]-cysteine methyltransferase